MKTYHWLGTIVGIFVIGGFIRSCSSDAATEKYVRSCSAIIHEASGRAEKAWTTSGKLSIMEKAFAQAGSITPPSNADRGTVVRMQHYLQEGREHFASADGEWTLVRDFVLGFIGGAVDASGACGLATGGLLTAKSAEIASDDAERREFIQAAQELDRYMSNR